MCQLVCSRVLSTREFVVVEAECSQWSRRGGAEPCVVLSDETASDVSEGRIKHASSGEEVTVVTQSKKGPAEWLQQRKNLERGGGVPRGRDQGLQ